MGPREALEYEARYCFAEVKSMGLLEGCVARKGPLRGGNHLPEHLVEHLVELPTLAGDEVLDDVSPGAGRPPFHSAFCEEA